MHNPHMTTIDGSSTRVQALCGVMRRDSCSGSVVGPSADVHDQRPGLPGTIFHSKDFCLTRAQSPDGGTIAYPEMINQSHYGTSSQDRKDGKATPERGLESHSVLCDRQQERRRETL